MPLFRNAEYTDVPIAYSLVYANQAARLAATGLTSADQGRIARQTDDGSFYILRSHSPLTWDLLGVPTAVGSYTHIQSSPATTWVINHNLGFYPVVEVRNAGGVVINGFVLHTSINQTQVTFNVAVAGTARAS